MKIDLFGELEALRARRNQMVDERPFRGIEGGDLSLAEWTPAVDIHETENEYVVRADLPEVKMEDAKVAFDDGVLTVEGERKQEKEETGKKFHKIERLYGKFVRRFALPTEVDATKVSAEFKEGVLSVHLPKSPPGKPKAIAVEVT
jgi:HSP20 family protein